MRSVAELMRERTSVLTGDEVMYAAIAALAAEGAAALRSRPRAGICHAGGCTKTTKARRDYCRVHDVGGRI